MSHPDDEILADAALGVDELAPEARQHLERCSTCASAVAELRRTRVLLAQGSTAVPSPAAWQSPPSRVWQQVAAATAGTPSGEVTRVDFTTTRQRRTWPWAAGMAAAGLALGLLTGRALWNEPPASTTTVAQAELDTLDTRERLGEAAVVRTDSGIDLRVATTTTLDPGDGYLEVWLINRDGKRMVSVGVLDAGAGTFPISQSLLDQGYLVVDISREPFDEEPEHSGDSLVRGTLPA